MGLILGALGGLGAATQEAGASMQKADQQADLQRQESDLLLQRQEALAQFNVMQTNQQREAQVGRIGTAAQGIVGSALAAKYASSDAAVAAADAGQTDAPLTDEQRAAIAQSKTLDQTTMLNDPRVKAQAAMNTGDYATAAELTKIADAGKVSAGWGGVVVDQNDIDPTTGQPRVIIDNSGGRLSLGEGANEARQTAAEARAKAAEAAMVRAKAIADGIGSRDPVLSSLAKSADSTRIELDRLRALDAQNPPRPGQSSAYAPLIEKAQQAYDDSFAKLQARQQQHLAKPPGGGSPGPAPSTPTGSPTRVSSQAEVDALPAGALFIAVDDPTQTVRKKQ